MITKILGHSMIHEFLNDISKNDVELPNELNFFHTTKYHSFCEIITRCGCNMSFRSNDYRNESIYFYYGIPNYILNVEERKIKNTGADFFPACLEVSKDAFINDIYEYTFVPTDSGYFNLKKELYPGVFAALFTKLSIKVSNLSSIIDSLRKFIKVFYDNNANYFDSNLKESVIIEEKYSRLKHLINIIQNEAHPDQRAFTCELIIEKKDCNVLNIKNSLRRVYIPFNCLQDDEVHYAINLLLESKSPNDIVTYNIVFEGNSGILDSVKEIKKLAKQWVQ